MNNKKIIIIAVVIVAFAFYGGLKYGTSTTPNRGTFSGQFGARLGGRGGAGGGFTSGSILSKDASSVTISLLSGGSEIVFMSTSTPITKNVVGTTDDLIKGENIMVSGTTNSDGSINASSIQIRPAQNLQNK